MLDPDNPLVSAHAEGFPASGRSNFSDPYEDAVDYDRRSANSESGLIAAFDARGVPVFPPDEHILDDLARRYDFVDAREQEQRPAAGTVAVVVELTDCDYCQRVARYETYVDDDGMRLPRPTCAACARERGDSKLGPGHTVSVLHLAEVPHSVRDVADQICIRLGRPSLWDAEPHDADVAPWCAALRGIGFIGPRSDGHMAAWLFGTHVIAEPMDSDTVRITAHSVDGRTMTAPNGGVYLPADYDPLQLREEVLTEVRGLVPWHQRARLCAVLRPSVRAATDHALSTLDSGTYRTVVNYESPPLTPGRYRRLGARVSAEHTAAVVAAEQNPEPHIVAALATRHPDPEIRALAVVNTHCPDDALMHIAETDQEPRVRRALIRRDARPAQLISTLATSVLVNGPLDTTLALDLLLHPDCPERLHAALMDRVYHAGPEFRLHAAAAANTAPTERRDYVHSTLLARSKRITLTIHLIDAILGEHGLGNVERIQWLLEHTNAHIARLADYYLADPQLLREGSLMEAFGIYRTPTQDN